MKNSEFALFYAVETRDSGAVVHAFPCLRERMRWMSMNPGSTAVAGGDWMVTSAVENQSVVVHNEGEDYSVVAVPQAEPAEKPKANGIGGFFSRLLQKS